MQRYRLFNKKILPRKRTHLPSSERVFEDNELIPLLHQWNLDIKRQVQIVCHIGSKKHVLKVDILLSDAHGPISLFENKASIRTDYELRAAVRQAVSYAALCGLNSFVVASPQALWVYGLRRNIEQLLLKVQRAELRERHLEVHKLLLWLR